MQAPTLLPAHYDAYEVRELPGAATPTYLVAAHSPSTHGWATAWHDRDRGAGYVVGRSLLDLTRQGGKTTGSFNYAKRVCRALNRFGGDA